MGRQEKRALSVEEAKRRLREACGPDYLLFWARRRPIESTFAAFLTGFLIAAYPDTCRAFAQVFTALVKRGSR